MSNIFNRKIHLKGTKRVLIKEEGEKKSHPSIYVKRKININVEFECVVHTNCLYKETCCVSFLKLYTCKAKRYVSLDVNCYDYYGIWVAPYKHITDIIMGNDKIIWSLLFFFCMIVKYIPTNRQVAFVNLVVYR